MKKWQFGKSSLAMGLLILFSVHHKTLVAEQRDVDLEAAVVVDGGCNGRCAIMTSEGRFTEPTPDRVMYGKLFDQLFNTTVVPALPGYQEGKAARESNGN
jgi:hypothetical protein